MYKKVSTALLFMAIGSLGNISTVMAADWDVAPYFNIAEIYTDDVDLDSTFAKSDLVTQATFGTVMATEGPRFNLNADYGLTYIYYPGLEGDKDEIRHSLSANSQSELSRDFLYFDFNSRVSQQFLDRRSAFSSINITRTENRATLSIVDASPYAVKKIGGNFAVMTTRYGFSYIDLSQNITFAGEDLGGISSTFHEASVNIDSGTKFTKFTWGVENSYRYESITNRINNNIYTSIASGDYQYTRMIAFTASAGYQKRNAASGGIPFSGFVWRIGGRLTPGPRTIISGSYGKDFFGNNFNFDASYEISPRMSFQISYLDRFRTNQAIVLEDFQNGFTNPAEIRQSFVDDNFVRDKAWRASLQGVRGRSTFALFATLNITDSFTDDNDFTRRAFGIIWNRTLSTRLNINASVSLMEDDFESDPQKDVFMSYQGGFNYNLSENIVAGIEFIHTKRKQRLFDYRERASNFVSANIGVTF